MRKLSRWKMTKTYELLKECPECSNIEFDTVEAEDGGYNCKTCKNQMKVSAEITAEKLLEQLIDPEIIAKYCKTQDERFAVNKSVRLFLKTLQGQKFIPSSVVSDDRSRILEEIDKEPNKLSSEVEFERLFGYKKGLEKAKQIILEMVKTNDI